MNKIVLVNLIKYSICICFILLFSCRCKLPLTSGSDVLSPYLNYDKVIVHLKVNNSQYQLRGYINSILDTSACFRFWGKLGFEVGRGLINDTFIYFNTFNNITYNNLKELMENNIGLYLNKYVIFNLLNGNTDKLAGELLSLNKDLINITLLNKNEINIINNVNLNNISIKYVYSNNRISIIKIIQKGSKRLFELKLEIIEISKEKKICRFSL